MFAYEVMNEQQAMAERFQLLKEGEYDAIITSSEDKVSANSGNPMMDMTVTVFDKQGKAHDVRDFLVFTKAMMWKVVHFADSAGCLPGYEDGKLCSEMAIDKHVRVKVAIESGKEIPQDKLNGKPMGSKYPDKNKIEDYIKKDENALVDDDVPF